MKSLFQNISKKERWILLGITVLVIILANIPYIFGFAFSQTGHTYLGIHSHTPEDYFVYYSYITQIQQGGFLLKNVFSTEPFLFGQFNWFWLSLGVVAKTFKISSIAIFHFARILLIPAFVFILYGCISQFFESRRLRLYTFLVSFGGGLGAALISIFGDAQYLNHGAGFELPIDLWMSHAFLFLMIQQSPHFIMSWILFLLFLFFSFTAIAKNKNMYALYAGISGMLLFNFHTYYFPILILINIVFASVKCIQNKKLFFSMITKLFIIISLSAMPVIYFAYLLFSDPALAVKSAQNITGQRTGTGKQTYTI